MLRLREQEDKQQLNSSVWLRSQNREEAGIERREIVKKYRLMYKSASEYARPIWDTRIKNFNLYVGKLPARKYKSEANFHVPYVSTLLNNVLPILTSRLPESKVVPRNTDADREAAKLMNALLDYTFDVNKFELTFINTVYSAMLHDTAWLRVGWDWQDSKTDHAAISILDSFDVYPHPRKVSLDDNWPIFIYTEMTKAEMLAKGWDKRAINGLGPSELKTETYRRQRLGALGMSIKEYEDGTKAKDDLYQVVEVWGEMDLSFKSSDSPKLEMGYLVIVNGESLVNLEPPPGCRQFASPYTHGKIPLAYLPYETIPGLLLGQSFIDPVGSQQEELNALENMKADNYKRRNNPPLLVRRDGNIDLGTLEFVNSVPWMVEQQGDIQQFEVPDLSGSIGGQQDMIRSVMQARTGANDVLLVSDDAAIKGGDSATGAAIANENTKTRFRPQATRIDGLIERVGELVINLYQDPRFFDVAKAIAIADEDGNNYPKLISAADVQGDLQFKVTSATSIAESNDAKLARAMNIKELYLQDPTINQDELDKPIFDAAGYDVTKVKRTMGSMLQDAAGRLQQLTMVAQAPQFGSEGPAQKAAVLNQINELRNILASGSGQQPMTRPGGNPSEVASESTGGSAS